MGVMQLCASGYTMKFKGIVLAGGQSSRFGEDKALVFVNGVRLIERAIHLLEELHLAPVLITSPGRDYSFLRCPVETDILPHKGPLGGIYTASYLFKGYALLILVCDMPFLTVPALATLVENHHEPQQATVFCDTRNEVQPFPGLYESDLSNLFLEEIRAERLSMQGFLKRIPNLKVVEAPVDANLFENINEKKDLCQ